MVKENREKGEITVYKSNSLIQAGYRLDINEQRIILDCISQVNSSEKLFKNDTFEVTAESLVANWGVSSNNAYNDLKRAVDSLFERYITIENKANSNTKHKRVLKTRWISSAEYVESEGKIEICFAQRILPYLGQLKEQFTKYKLKHVVNMKSVYGLRLYELLVQHKQFKLRDIEIAWIRKHFQLGYKYKSVKDLKKRVIDPAIKDVNDTSDLWVKYSQQKTGRRVSHFTFEFGPKNEASNSKTGKKKLTKKIIENNALPGESWKNAKERLARLEDN